MAFQMRGPMVPQTNGGPGIPVGRRKNRAFGTMVRSGALHAEARAGLFLQQRGALLAPSARPAGLDDVDGGPDCRVYIQMRCIEQVRIWRTFQWCRGAGLVAFIALKNIRQHCGFIDIPPLRAVFGRAAAGAYLRAGGDESLNVGIGADDGANVTAIENRPWRGGGKLALEGKQGGADLRNGRHDRCSFADSVGLEDTLVEARRIKRFRGVDRSCCISCGSRVVHDYLSNRVMCQSCVGVWQGI